MGTVPKFFYCTEYGQDKRGILATETKLNIFREDVYKSLKEEENICKLQTEKRRKTIFGNGSQKLKTNEKEKGK